MSSNGLPPKDYRDVPTSAPAPLPRVKRDDVRRVEMSKSDGLNSLVTLAMLGMTMDFSCLGVLDLPKSESESSE
jgi:hypothetical protein